MFDIGLRAAPALIILPVDKMFEKRQVQNRTLCDLFCAKRLVMKGNYR